MQQLKFILFINLISAFSFAQVKTDSIKKVVPKVEVDSTFTDTIQLE